MALAETQTLEVLLKFTTSGQGNISKVESQLKSLGGTTTSATGAVSKGMNAVEKAAGGVGNALSHAKSQIGGLLTGPLGFVGLTAGLFGVGSAIEHAISDAQALGIATQKLTAITGESIQTASAQIAVFEKYGIASDRVIQIAGFAEKTLGKLADTTAKVTASQATLNLEQQKAQLTADGASKAQLKLVSAEIARSKAQDALAGASSKLDAIDQQYGLHLVDTNGKVVDFQNELLQVADLYTNKAIPAQEKATLAAQLFGRGYTALIPILSLGRQGILDAESAAQQLGLTLNAQSAGELAQYTKDLRAFGENIHGLLLQVGLTLIPILDQAAVALTNFLKPIKEGGQGGAAQILQVIKQVVEFAKQAGAAIMSVGGTVANIWNGLPPQFRQLLIEGFVANKVIKFTFGIDPIKLAAGAVTDVLGKLAGGLIKGVLGINAGVVNVNGGVVNSGGLPVGGAGATAAEDAAAAAGGGITAATVATAVGAWVVGIGGAIGVANLIKTLTGTTDAQQQYNQTTGQFGRRSASNVPLVKGVYTHGTALGDLLPGASRDTDRTLGSVADVLKMDAPLIAGIKPALDLLHQDLEAQLKLLATSNDPKVIGEAAAKLAQDALKGAGNVANTKSWIAELTAKLKTATDPVEKRLLEQAIAVLNTKLAGREWIAAQERAAEKIAKSNLTTAQKVEDLKTIQRRLLAQNDTTAASIVGELITGFGDTVGALNALKTGINVNLPGILPQVPRRNQNAPDKLPTAPSGAGNPDRGQNRGHIVAGAMMIINTRVTTRAVDSGGATQSRYGPTPSRAGAAVVLVD